MEFTARGDFAHEVFGELTKYAIKNFRDDHGRGLGDRCSGGFAVYGTGSKFYSDTGIERGHCIACNRRKVLWSPGCGTLTEIARAEELGCEIVKLFPGDIYGPQFVKGIKGPHQPRRGFPHLGNGTGAPKAGLRNTTSGSNP